MLVCDDEPQILRALRVVLREAGFEVVPAETGAGGARPRGGPAARRRDHRPRAARRRRHRGLPRAARVERDADHRALARSATRRRRSARSRPAPTTTSSSRSRRASSSRGCRRRCAAPAHGADEPAIRADGLEIDLAAHTVRARRRGGPPDADRVRLLRTLARNRGRLLTHRALLVEVWGPAYADDTAVLRTHIANLRRKIEPPGEARATSAPTPASATASRADLHDDLDARGPPHLACGLDAAAGPASDPVHDPSRIASVLDSLRDVSSLAFAALAFGVAVPRPRGARPRMSGAELVGLVVAVARVRLPHGGAAAPGAVLR